MGRVVAYVFVLALSLLCNNPTVSSESAAELQVSERFLQWHHLEWHFLFRKTCFGPHRFSCGRSFLRRFCQKTKKFGRKGEQLGRYQKPWRKKFQKCYKRTRAHENKSAHRDFSTRDVIHTQSIDTLPGPSASVYVNERRNRFWKKEEVVSFVVAAFSNIR